MEDDRHPFERAIETAINYHGVDARLGIPDYQLAEAIMQFLELVYTTKQTSEV